MRHQHDRACEQKAPQQITHEFTHREKVGLRRGPADIGTVSKVEYKDSAYERLGFRSTRFKKEACSMVSVNGTALGNEPIGSHRL